MSSRDNDAISVFRDELIINGYDDIEGKLEDSDILVILDASSTSIGFSSTRIKKAIFSYVFFTNDTKVINSALSYFYETIEAKSSLSIEAKRMISFFLKIGTKVNSKDAHILFAKTFGIGSRAHIRKVKSHKDYVKFSKAYINHIQPLIGMIKRTGIKRMPYLKGIGDE